MTEPKTPEQQQKEQKDMNTTYLTIGILFIVIGITTMNVAFLVIGFVFFILGTSNNPDPFNTKDWWPQKKNENPTPPTEEPFTREDLPENK